MLSLGILVNGIVGNLKGYWSDVLQTSVLRNDHVIITTK